MKKIFAFVASNSNNSSTLHLLSEILKGMKNLDNKIVYDIYHSESLNLKQCLGCGQCFNVGKCHLDQLDDMNMLKERMLESDIIIFASPVYAHNVSGTMKIFIDRISYWLHLLRLSGKLGVSFVTTSNNGDEYVESYLIKVLTYLGINVVGKYGYKTLNKNNVEREFIDSVCSNLIESIEINRWKSNQTLENIFNFFKSTYSSINKDVLESSRNSEIRYWVDTGLIHYNSLQEYIVESKNIANNG